jgi:hypothetical protein
MAKHPELPDKEISEGTYKAVTREIERVAENVPDAVAAVAGEEMERTYFEPIKAFAASRIEDPEPRGHGARTLRPPSKEEAEAEQVSYAGDVEKMFFELRQRISQASSAGKKGEATLLTELLGYVSAAHDVAFNSTNENITSHESALQKEGLGRQR